MRTDLVLAWRTLRRTPGLSVVAFVCLATAIGIASAAFIVIHSALLAPLPIQHGERLVMVHEIHVVRGYNVPHSPEQFALARERSRSFEALGAWYTRNVRLGGDSDPGAGLVRAAFVSANALDMIGLAPMIGRLPSVQDATANAEPVVLLGYDVWRSWLGSDPNVVNRVVDISGQPHAVIGVMPAGVRFPIREDLWVPIRDGAPAESLTVFGRLRKGVSRRQAMAELTVISSAERARTSTNATAVSVMPFERGFMSPGQEWAIYAFIAGLLLFLIVVAGNVANLFFARNASRLRDIAVQSALGAGRRQLMMPLLIESLLLGGGAAFAGILVARASVSWVLSTVTDLPWWADFGFTPAVIAFVLFAAVLASAVAGLGPAVRLTRIPLVERLKGELSFGRLRFSRLGAAMIVVQVAISVAFLSVAGVLSQALLGFDYEKYSIAGSDVLVSQVYMGAPANSELNEAADRREVYRRHFERSLRQFERISERLREMPHVTHVTFSSHFPGNDVEATRIDIAGNGGSNVTVVTRFASIGPDFFATLGARIVYGRDFGDADHSGPPRTVIVNEPFARKYFSNGAALGQRLRLADTDADPGPWLVVVGIVPDLALNPGDPGRADGIYVPFTPSSFARIAVRSRGDPRLLVAPLHDSVLRERATAQVQSAETLEAQMSTAGDIFRGLGAGLLSIGFTALLLSAVSIYALVSFAVAQRTKEIGIRIAVGASRGHILRAVLQREMTLLITGSALGLFLGLGLYQVVAMMPFDLRPAGPSLVMGFIVLIALAGGGACFVPARRALRVEPVEALRHI
jgi:predicted permease